MSMWNVTDLPRLDGLFEGMLSPDEQELFNAAVEAGVASREYSGGAGFMGLAKVRLNYQRTL